MAKLRFGGGLPGSDDIIVVTIAETGEVLFLFGWVPSAQRAFDDNDVVVPSWVHSQGAAVTLGARVRMLAKGLPDGVRQCIFFNRVNGANGGFRDFGEG